MKSYRTEPFFILRTIVNMSDSNKPSLNLASNKTSTSSETTDTIVEVSSLSTASSSEPSPKPKQLTALQRHLAGVSLALISSVSFSFSCFIVQSVTDIKPSQKALFPYVGTMIFSYPVIQESKEPCFGPANWWWRLWMLLGGICGATSLFLQYTALNYISLTETMIIMLATPVCVLIIASLFLGDKFGLYHLLSLVLSIVGILFATTIGGIDGKDGSNSTTTTTVITGEFSDTSMTTTTDSYSGTTESEDSSSANYLLGALLALGAMLFNSLSHIMMRNLRTTNPSVIRFNFSLISLVEISIINYAFYDFKLPNTGYSSYMLAVLGVISYYAQMIQTKATQIEDEGVVSAVKSSGETFFAFIFQIVFTRDIPGLFTILGAILVLASVLLLSLRKYIISLVDVGSLEERIALLIEHWFVPDIPANPPPVLNDNVDDEQDMAAEEYVPNPNMGRNSSFTGAFTRGS